VPVVDYDRRVGMAPLGCARRVVPFGRRTRRLDGTPRQIEMTRLSIHVPPIAARTLSTPWGFVARTSILTKSERSAWCRGVVWMPWASRAGASARLTSLATRMTGGSRVRPRSAP